MMEAFKILFRTFSSKCVEAIFEFNNIEAFFTGQFFVFSDEIESLFEFNNKIEANLTAHTFLNLIIK